MQVDSVESLRTFQSVGRTITKHGDTITQGDKYNMPGIYSQSQMINLLK